MTGRTGAPLLRRVEADCLPERQRMQPQRRAPAVPHRRPSSRGCGVHSTAGRCGPGGLEWVGHGAARGGPAEAARRKECGCEERWAACEVGVDCFRWQLLWRSVRVVQTDLPVPCGRSHVLLWSGASRTRTPACCCRRLKVCRTVLTWGCLFCCEGGCHSGLSSV
jgi:hypothetical protein